MIIGLEGVSCTGKTTLARALAERLGASTVIPCYYHAAPDPSIIPDPAVTSEADQLHSLAVHLDIEELRWERAHAALRRGDRVVLDRTVDTLLAHLRAVGVMTGLDANHEARTMVEARIARQRAVVPSATLLLRADDATVAGRARSRVGMPAIYYDPAFTTGFLTHFVNPITPRVVPVDASLPAEQVLDVACRLLMPYLDGSS